MSKQSTQAKQLTARNKNALVLVTIQENKITPHRTILKVPKNMHRSNKEHTNTIHESTRGCAHGVCTNAGSPAL